MSMQDRRVKRTQRRLASALIELTLEKGFDAVTIRDITERADVGYATFFRHYKDKHELLKDILDVVLIELVELLRSARPASAPDSTGVLIFRYVQEHHEVIRALLGTYNVRQQILKAATATTLNETGPRPGSIVPLEIASYHIVASSIALIEWWLDHNMPYPIELMGNVYEELIARPTNEAALLPKEQPSQ
ncbi:TetR/AcrR family transcriptional regulator [Dictyobacter aurantiacus]|uniref:TetR family transcriptional regulator n=1 Tax=Dictyobacter aurantiacus TaxID=1936993 RepID=A0A401ZNU9_9CHLR|nr:TetR/AcrR family transcriptional regulator [Dictyobacter aurantiacus]GCE08522.1 TetR family transcriptional regulator [Dictyobacter aurantiacus]